MSTVDVDFVERVRAELNEIVDPCSVGAGNPMGVVDMGLVEAIELDDAGTCTIRFRLTAPGCLMVGLFREESRTRLERLPGIEQVEVCFDSGLDWSPSMLTPDAAGRRAKHLERLQLLQ